jgi:SprT protein
MRFFKQLELIFIERGVALEGGARFPSASVINSGEAAVFSASVRAGLALSERSIHLRRRDETLESKARELLRALGADKLAREIRVEWNPRLKTAAGRADFREKLISLNPLLRDVRAGLVVNGDEVDRTLRHELAHLLAQFRVGRRRIAPHGPEWREACRDLDIADEARCHNLPFASKSFPPRYVYRCPVCRRDFPRVRRVRRAVACLACCRAHNRGEFDAHFRLKLIKHTNGSS